MLDQTLYNGCKISYISVAIEFIGWKLIIVIIYYAN